MNYQKFQIGAKSVGKGTKQHSIPPAGRALEHNCRTDPDRARGNEKIDPKRTHLNYDLAEDLRKRLHGGKTASKIYDERLEQARKKYQTDNGKKMKKDTVSMCSVVVTAPQDLPEEKRADFFKESYDYLVERYGEENVLAANVHMDETTPHMHFQFMPFVQDKKHGGLKLCAKDLETPKTLKTMHPQLEKRLTEKLKCPVHLLNGATLHGNKTKLELEIQSLREALDTLNNDSRAKTLIKRATTGKALSDDERKAFTTLMEAEKTVLQSLEEELEEVKKQKERYETSADDIETRIDKATEFGRKTERDRLTIQLNNKDKQITALSQEKEELLRLLNKLILGKETREV